MKFKIALRNLYISQAIILIFLIFAYYTWFPHSFAKLGGFYKTAWMLIIVDLVLGPALVFFIYKENKKYLRFDINVLLSIQIIAFVFGAYSLFLKHPAYAVFSVDRFVVTNVSNIYPQPSWSEQIKHHFFNSTDLVVANFPDATTKRNDLIIEVVLNGKPDIDSRPKYFKPFYQNTDSLKNKSINIDKLILTDREKAEFSDFFNKHNSNTKNYAFFPLRGNNQIDMIWAFDKNSFEPIDIIDIDPWKFNISAK